MDKLIADQGFVMNMIDKMQDQLIDKNIISNTDKVPVNPVASHPQNIETFNSNILSHSPSFTTFSLLLININGKIAIFKIRRICIF